MRLSTTEGELPLDKYVRYKNNLQLWYDEMIRYGLTEQEQKIVTPYFKSSYGVPPSQEQLMTMLMDPHICHFSLAEANAARKIVGKKQLAKVPALQEKVHNTACSPALGNYIWDCGVKPQMSYAFSIIHATAYSFIGFQTAYLATNWNPIFWNTACLIVDSGSLEEDNDFDEDEDDTTAKKNKSTDYGKIASAIGNIMKHGIQVSLVDINNSAYTFKPDIKNNKILFGMKGLNKVGDDVVDAIIAGRPYQGLMDFVARCKVNKTVVISLIKAGAFDNLDSWADKYGDNKRKAIMALYLSITSEPKKKLTLQNFKGLLDRGVVPAQFDFEIKAYWFNKYLKSHTYNDYYELADDSAYEFYKQCDAELADLYVYDDKNLVTKKQWDKRYKSIMDSVREWLKQNQTELLDDINQSLFLDEWNKYASGTLSAWEMDSLCFYYHEHELSNLDKNKYGIDDFYSLSEEPVVDKYFKRGGHQIPIFKLNRIVGTVINKNNTKGHVTLLTVDGVVNVAFSKEYYAMFNRQISEKDENGKKKVKEKGWFTRGTMIMVTGIRREDTFRAKTYKSTGGHQLYKITKVTNNGHDIEITHDRYQGTMEEDE